MPKIIKTLIEIYIYGHFDMTNDDACRISRALEGLKNQRKSVKQKFTSRRITLSTSRISYAQISRKNDTRTSYWRTLSNPSRSTFSILARS